VTFQPKGFPRVQASIHLPRRRRSSPQMYKVHMNGGAKNDKAGPL
jgi:hypothetical protein